MKHAKCGCEINDDGDMMWLKWIFIMNFFEIEYLEGNISDAMFTKLNDYMLHFKPRD